MSRHSKKAKNRKSNNRRPVVLKRGYDAGKTGELFQDFLGNVTSPLQDLQVLSRIRGRSRDLVQNNDYAKHAMRLIKNNVAGWEGIQLQVKSMNANGVLDVADNKLIKNAFVKWGKKKTASVDGRLSWIDCQHQFIETVAKDGECLVRKVAFNNEFGFSLQFIDMDRLETDFNDDLRNGNTIRMSIESDSWGRPVAYHILSHHPNDTNRNGQKRIRIPAGEMIHCFVPDRPNQPRGVPWLTSAITRLKMLGGYEEAELVAARVASAKVGFYTKPVGDKPYTGDDEDSLGNAIQELEPGTFEELPYGWDFKTHDPQHPNSAFNDFLKAMLRGVAGGIGISYNALSNDLESVNYSSMRSGKLDERDSWKVIQTWMANNFCQEVYSGGTINFLYQGMLGGPLTKLPFTKWDKFDTVSWKPRGWEWVDPEKEVRAHREEIAAGFTSHTRVLAKRGIEFKELLEEIKEERELMEEMNISFEPPEKESALQGEATDGNSDQKKKSD